MTDNRITARIGGVSFFVPLGETYEQFLRELETLKEAVTRHEFPEQLRNPQDREASMKAKAERGRA